MSLTDSDQDLSGQKAKEEGESAPILASGTPLSDTKLFSETAIKVFKSYWIENLGQLLGATKGLTLVEVFKEIPDGEDLLQGLKKRIPYQVLEFHKDYKFSKPTGYIIRDGGGEVSGSEPEQVKPAEDDQLNLGNEGSTDADALN